jgi:hypothetical protein
VPPPPMGLDYEDLPQGWGRLYLSPLTCGHACCLFR